MDTSIKTDKITRVLILYHQLMDGMHINKAAFAWEHGITERSFDRDIEDVRLFLSEIYSPRELRFDRDTGTYYLTGSKPSYLDRMDAAVIGKLLLESEVLRKDEMHGLYQALLSAVSPRDADAVNQYLRTNIVSYRSSTKAALLKTVSDLFEILREGMDIELLLHSSEHGPCKIKVFPLEITVEHSAFYLIASTGTDLNQIEQFAMEQIESFTVLHSGFARKLQKEYIKQYKISKPFIENKEM